MIPLGLLGAVGMLIGILYDPQWSTSLRQNLPSEMIGVAVGTLATVFIVDQLLKRQEHARWAPVRFSVFSTVRNNIELALGSVNPYLQLGAQECSGSQLVDVLALVTAETSEPLQSRIDGLLARDVLHSIELLTPRVEKVLETIDVAKFALADRPDFIRKWLDLQHAFEMLQSSEKLNKMSHGSPVPSKSGPTIGEHAPLVAFPLLNTVRALAKLHYAASDEVG